MQCYLTNFLVENKNGILTGYRYVSVSNSNFSPVRVSTLLQRPPQFKLEEFVRKKRLRPVLSI